MASCELRRISLIIGGIRYYEEYHWIGWTYVGRKLNAGLCPGTAVDAALEIHERVRRFNASPLASARPTICCAGIGFGSVFAISPNLAKNGAFEAAPVNGITTKGGDQGEPGDVSFTRTAIGVDSGRGGEFAATERVGTTFDTGNNSGVRITLPD